MSKREDILELFATRSSVKQDVYDKVAGIITEVKHVMKELEGAYRKQTTDKRVKIAFEDAGTFGARFRFGGDTLIFHMHSNVFNFDAEHPVSTSDYVKEDPTRGYCGIIHVYNFLSDSFKYNRENDMGYLICRIFVNREGHFFVEGKGEMNELFKNFSGAEMSPDQVKLVVESAVLFALQFELLTPAYDQVQLVTVSQMKQLSNNMKQRTGKRLGFEFGTDSKINS